MESRIIKQILDKYFDGKSSLEEEARLRKYFNSQDIDQDLLPYQGLFVYLEKSADLSLSDSFDEKLDRKIAESKKEAVVRTLPFSWIRVAAMIALVVGGLVVMNKYLVPSSGDAVSESIDWSKYEPENTEDAYKTTLAALALVSNKMKTGEEETAKSISKINAVNQQIKH